MGAPAANSPPARPPFSAPVPALARWAGIAGIWLRGAAGHLLARRRSVLIGGCGVLLVAWLLAHFGWDRAWLDELVHERPADWIEWARKVSKWGELHLAPGLALGVLGLAAWLTRRPRWAVAAAVGGLAGVVAGLFALLLKLVFGRPRPHLHVPDHLEWFAFSPKWQSFPSGHATHCFAIAAAVAWLSPRWGAWLGLAAGVVGWSRMYLERHYPSDVLAGAALGLTLGGALGLAARDWWIAQTSAANAQATTSDPATSAPATAPTLDRNAPTHPSALP